MISVMLSHAAAGSGRYFAALARSLLASLVGLLKEWRYRSDIHKLQAMSDRQLSDIGLTRGRIEAAVRGDTTAPRQGMRNTSLRSQFRL